MHQKVAFGQWSDTPMEMIVIGKTRGRTRERVGGASEGIRRHSCQSGQRDGGGSTEGRDRLQVRGQTKNSKVKHTRVYQGVLATPLAADAKDKGPRISAITVPNQQSVYIDKAYGAARCATS